MTDKIEERDPPKEGERVHVYWNIHEDCLSVRKDGLVVMHTDSVVLDDCSFRVQPAGLEKARRTGVRNVHAYVSGHWTNEEAARDGTKVKYDPWEVGAFHVAESGREVWKADRVEVAGTTVWIDD